MRVFTLCFAIVFLSCLVGTSSADPREEGADAPARLDLSPPTADPAPMPTPEPALEVAPLPTSASTTNDSAYGTMDSYSDGYPSACCENVWEGYCGQRRQSHRCWPSCGFSLPTISMPQICFPSCRPSCCEPACEEDPCCESGYGRGCLPCLGELRNRCSSLWASCGVGGSDCGCEDPCGCALSEPCGVGRPCFGWPRIGWGRSSCSDSGCNNMFEEESYQYHQETIESIPTETAPVEPTPASDRAAQQPWGGPLSALFQL